MSGPDDTLARARTGDRDAFRDLYLTHHASLYRYALGETGNPDDAEDLVQEVFVKAWSALGGFRNESSLLHWLFRIARNLLIDRARSRRRHPTLSLDAPIGDDSAETRGDRTADTRPEPSEAAERTESLSQFQQAFDALPADQRTVFALREWDGLSYEEIAQRLNLNIGTVRSRLARARETLKDRMRNFADAPASGQRGEPTS